MHLVRRLHAGPDMLQAALADQALQQVLGMAAGRATHGGRQLWQTRRGANCSKPTWCPINFSMPLTSSTSYCSRGSLNQ